ncbi:MAG: 7-carboxy-7-deazaguanine synthase [Hyphomicrobiaceae bacterium]|nr:7-carboxy-7-deazaguanine synthase [Hyphomicrobiaceae bacterium]
MYQVKEIFYTLQGEGANAGRPAIFCRFAGCNLWSGVEADRSSAACAFCDTDFVGTDGTGGGKFKRPDELVTAIVAAAEDGVEESEGGGGAPSLVVLTGGEPMLQVDLPLITALHSEGFEVAIETNGTFKVPRAIDWICVSPKAGTKLVQRSGDELKLVYPQEGLPPEDCLDLDFQFRFLQPMDGADAKANTTAAIAYVKANPEWRLSLQTHKLIGIP